MLHQDQVVCDNEQAAEDLDEVSTNAMLFLCNTTQYLAMQLSFRRVSDVM